MGITNVNKQIDKSQIDCDGTLKVTLSLCAAPNITEHPVDIVLVLDRSRSMSGSPLENMKAGAETFIDIIDESTDGNADGNIGSGSHIGIVSFASTATVNAQLITSVDTLKEAVQQLSAGGTTNHADAFSKAIQLFDPSSSNEKVIVMFTDGKTTTGAPPTPVAEAAKAAGIIIYCIGLIGDNGIDVDTLNEWASDPVSSHVAVTPDDSELEDLFSDLAGNISKPGATNIVIDELVNPDFHIISVVPPNKGTAMMTDPNGLQWKIPALGVSKNEGAVLEFYIKHITQNPGTKLINKSIEYSDSEGNTVTFPEPSVKVDCGIIVTPEPCPIPVDFQIGKCQDAITVNLGDAYLESLGRIVQLDVTVKNVCPNRRVALGIILKEIDCEGKEHQRGMKAITIPAHHYPGCKDILVKCVKFVLPEDLNVSCKNHGSLCSTRNFKVQVIAHNIDTDFRCCESVVYL